MAHPAEAAIRELIERGVELGRSYAIFEELGNAHLRNLPAYADHVDFFEATANAHFQSIFIITYLLYDRRRRVKSIPNMLAQFAQSRPKSVSQLRQQISDHTPILNTIADIRGSIYAHRHGVLTPEQVLRRAKLTKGLLRSTVDMATRQLSVLGALAGIESRRELRVEFNRRAKYAQDDARLVIKALAKRGAL